MEKHQISIISAQFIADLTQLVNSSLSFHRDNGHNIVSVSEFVQEPGLYAILIVYTEN